MLYVGSSTVLDRRMRIIGRMMVFIFSLEFLLMLVLVQKYGLLLFANSIVLLPILHLCNNLILAILSLLQLCTYNFRRSSSEEYEIGGFEDTEMCDDEGNPEHEVHYYYDLVAMNNNGTTDREQQQYKQKENQHTLYSAV